MCVLIDESTHSITHVNQPYDSGQVDRSWNIKEKKNLNCIIPNTILKYMDTYSKRFVPNKRLKI